MTTETVSMLGLMFIEIQPKHIQLFIFSKICLFRRCQCSCTMILPPRIDQNVMGSSNIQSKIKSSSPENMSGNLDNFGKTPLKDTIGILKDEPVVEEKKQIKRNPPNSLASEQSTQGTGTRTRRVIKRLHVLRTIQNGPYSEPNIGNK